MFYPLGENSEKPQGGGIQPPLSPLIRPRVKVEYLIHRNKYFFNAKKKKKHEVNTKKIINKKMSYLRKKKKQKQPAKQIYQHQH